MQFLKRVLVLMLILLLVWAVPLVFLPEIFGYNLPSNLWGDVYLLLPPLIHIAIVVVYYAKGCPLFVLPIGHFIFPLFLFTIMFLTSALRVTPGDADWVLSWMVISVVYFWLSALITLIISIIMWRKHKKSY